MAAELAAEQDRSETLGLRYAEAVAHWQELGGYAEEAAWNAACGIVLGQPYDAVSDRSSPSSRVVRLNVCCVEALFRSEASLLLSTSRTTSWTRRQALAGATHDESKKTILFREPRS